MKIKSINIYAFGKFENYKLDFSDGLNLIYGANEDGKTTVMSFIKMMFYGTSGKSQDLSKNLRKKYQPWSGKPMAGSIDFVHQNTEYRLEREFKASNSTDKITLILLNDGRQISVTGSTDLGKKFIGLSESAFERCSYIGQLGVLTKDGDAESEINTRLSNLALSGDEDVSYNENIARLEKLKFSLISKRKTIGICDKHKERLIEAKEELALANTTATDHEKLILKIDNEKKSLADCDKEITKLKALMSAAEINRNYDKLKDYISAENTISSCKQKLVNANGKEINLEFTDKVNDKISEIKSLTLSLKDKKAEEEKLNTEVEELKGKTDTSLTEKIESLIKKSENDKIESDKISAEIKVLEEKSEKLKTEKEDAEKEKPKFNFLYLIISALGLIVALAGFLLSPVPYSLIGGAIFAVGLVLFLALKKKPKYDLEAIVSELATCKDTLYSLKDRLSSLLEQSASDSEALLVLKSEMSGNTALLIAKTEDLKKKTEEVKEAEERIAEIKKELDGDFTGMKNADTVQGMEIILFSLKDNLSKLEKAELTYNLLKKDLGGISPDEAKEKLNEVPHDKNVHLSLETIKEKLSYKENERSALKENITFDEAKERNDYKFAVNPILLEREIKELERKIKEEEFVCASCEMAIEGITEAFSQMRKNFGSVIDKRASKIFSAITDGNYNEMRVSKEFDIAVTKSDTFGSKEWQYLSSGTVDQAYFALRLAVSEFLSKDSEPLPIFIDDAFCQYDDSRQEKAMEFLKKYSENNQVVFLSCHRPNEKFGEIKTL